MDLYSNQYRMMGTIISVMIGSSDPNQAKTLLTDVQAMMADFERRFSANNNQSDLMEVNLAAGQNPVKVDQDLFDLIVYGKEKSIASDLALNIAIGPLIKLWRIGFKDAHQPQADEVTHALTLIDPHFIELDPAQRTVYLSQAGMEIDLGALAKGYFADQAKSYLLAAGIDIGIINLGGNVLTLGKPDRQLEPYWKVGIQNPQAERNKHLGFVKVVNQSVVTSGIYERQLETNGRQFHHIFDSKTGYPIENDLASVTVIADQSLACEAWTTILFNLNRQAAIDLINQTKAIEGVVVDRHNQVYISNGLKDSFIKI